MMNLAKRQITVLSGTQDSALGKLEAEIGRTTEKVESLDALVASIEALDVPKTAKRKLYSKVRAIIFAYSGNL